MGFCGALLSHSCNKVPEGLRDFVREPKPCRSSRGPAQLPHGSAGHSTPTCPLSSSRSQVPFQEPNRRHAFTLQHGRHPGETVCLPTAPSRAQHLGRGHRCGCFSSLPLGDILESCSPLPMTERQPSPVTGLGFKAQHSGATSR